MRAADFLVISPVDYDYFRLLGALRSPTSARAGHAAIAPAAASLGDALMAPPSCESVSQLTLTMLRASNILPEGISLRALIEAAIAIFRSPCERPIFPDAFAAPSGVLLRRRLRHFSSRPSAHAQRHARAADAFCATFLSDARLHFKGARVALPGGGCGHSGGFATGGFSIWRFFARLYRLGDTPPPAFAAICRYCRFPPTAP